MPGVAILSEAMNEKECSPCCLDVTMGVDVALSDKSKRNGCFVVARTAPSRDKDFLEKTALVTDVDRLFDGSAVENHTMDKGRLTMVCRGGTPVDDVCQFEDPLVGTPLSLIHI